MSSFSYWNKCLELGVPIGKENLLKDDFHDMFVRVLKRLRQIIPGFVELPVLDV